MEFKDKLKNYRKENKLTQQELANLLGVSRSNIAEMEAGRVKGALKLISKLSEISGRDMLYWTGDTKINIKTYESLDILIDAMISKGIIKEDGTIPESHRDVVIGVLEKEIALKISREKENS